MQTAYETPKRIDHSSRISSVEMDRKFSLARLIASSRSSTNIHINDASSRPFPLCFRKKERKIVAESAVAVGLENSSGENDEARIRIRLQIDFLLALDHQGCVRRLKWARRNPNFLLALSPLPLLSVAAPSLV